MCPSQVAACSVGENKRKDDGRNRDRAGMDKAEEGNGPAEVRGYLLPLSRACGKGKHDTLQQSSQS